MTKILFQVWSRDVWRREVKKARRWGKMRVAVVAGAERRLLGLGCRLELAGGTNRRLVNGWTMWWWRWSRGRKGRKKGEKRKERRKREGKKK